MKLLRTKTNLQYAAAIVAQLMQPEGVLIASGEYPSGYIITHLCRTTHNTPSRGMWPNYL